MQPRVSSPTVPSAVFELLLSKTRSVAAPSSMPLRMRRATSGARAHRSAGAGKRGRGRAGPPQPPTSPCRRSPCARETVHDTPAECARPAVVGPRARPSRDTRTHTRTHTQAERHRQTHPDTRVRSRTHRIRAQNVHNHPGGRLLQHRGSSHTARCGTQHRARHPRPTRKATDAGRNAKLRSAPLMAAAE